MKTTINIEDDFDLDKIMNSGQCFRVRKFDDNMFRFMTGDKILYIKRENDTEFLVSCDIDTWKNIWYPYFDLSRNYNQLRGKTCNNDFVMKAMNCGSGLRVLHQDTWEMLITFIISQRKSIPAISRAVEELAHRFGKRMTTDYETLYLFPTPDELFAASEEELSACGLGYRTPYVKDAVSKVVSGEINMNAIGEYGDEELFDTLLTIHGVGKKVANCVCLFGYGRTSRAPVDVWIARAIETEFQGTDPFPQYGKDAGIIQQYIFYYQKTVDKGI